MVSGTAPGSPVQKPLLEDQVPQKKGEVLRESRVGGYHILGRGGCLLYSCSLSLTNPEKHACHVLGRGPGERHCVQVASS